MKSRPCLKYLLQLSIPLLILTSGRRVDGSLDWWNALDHLEPIWMDFVRRTKLGYFGISVNSMLKQIWIDRTLVCQPRPRSLC